MSLSHERWALLIGINDYPNLAPAYQLHGCVNDAELMARLLQDSFAFPPEHITLLCNAEATRDAILAALDALVGRVGADDVVALHYSGHGSQMRDREDDEPDGYDETIVPYDSGRGETPNRDITDDEIYLRLLRLTRLTPYVTLLFDCCHSGTLARDAFGPNARWVERDQRPLDELPPTPAPELVGQRRRDVGPSGWLPLGQRYVLVAGCRDEESSYEHQSNTTGGVLTHGALTYYLGQELARATPGATYRDVFERAAAQVTGYCPRQHPQMEGARDRELFGVHDIAPLRYVPVAARTWERLTLGAGAAHGLTVGSRWAIVPAGTRELDEAAPRLGVAEITRVAAISAQARLTTEVSANAVAAGAWAVEEAHAYGEMRLAVESVVPAGYEAVADELRGVIERSALLRLSADGGAAEARIYLLAPRLGAARDDPLPQLGAIDRATWAVVGPDGRLMMPLHGIEEPGAAVVVLDNLEKAARYRQTLALRNANPDGLLQGKVGFALLRQGPGGAWAPAEPEEAGGQVVFTEKDCVALEITNRHTAPIYISVLDLGLTGAISVLHPIAGAAEQLAPGRSIHVGRRAGDEIELYLPDNFPYAPDPTDLTPVGGTETFKLIATTHEADFGSLAQPGYRAVGPDRPKGIETPLGQLLELALTGHGTREARRNRLAADEEWTTVERSFFLQRGR